jgi:hypothetical protein
MLMMKIMVPKMMQATHYIYYNISHQSWIIKFIVYATEAECLYNGITVPNSIRL